ncbi:MAG: diguanylate cyclase [Betaproteobacteria bacterium]|nr:diguanylate cyclase [Betaproteobacteria bacterium]
MIRFGTPVFDSAGRKKGVIVLNYFGNELLQHFRVIMQGGDPHSSMLLNHDGYWLSGAKREDEWGFMLGKSERTFGHDFPEEWRAISASERGTLQTAKGLFVYTTVYPLLPGQHSSTGSTLAHAPSQQEMTAHEYSWKIVSFVPHAVLTGAAFYNQPSGRTLLGAVYLLLALAAWTVASVTLNREQARAELARSKACYDELTQRIPVGAYLFRFHADGSMNFEYVSPVFCQMLDLDADAVLRDASIAFAAAHPDDLKSLIRSNQEVAVSLKPFRWEGRFIIRGETRWVHIASDPSPQPGGGSLWSGVVSDITERKQLEDELKRQARIDLLTGLNNRRHFFELAEQELARAKRYGAPLQVLMLDVDHFKLVNDTYGHHIGDLVLQKLSEVCVQTLRGIDILGRIGGEEFAILLPETRGEQALEVAERLRLSIAGAAVPLEQGGSVHLTVSIGVASVVAMDARIDDVLKRADMALYAAKNAGRNRVCG